MEIKLHTTFLRTRQRVNCVYGVKYRRLCTRLGPALARVVYRMLKDNVQYEPLRLGEYEKRYEAQQLKYLQKKAAKLGKKIVPEYPGDEKGGLVGRPPYL